MCIPRNRCINFDQKSRAHHLIFLLTLGLEGLAKEGQDILFIESNDHLRVMWICLLVIWFLYLLFQVGFDETVTHFSYQR